MCGLLLYTQKPKVLDVLLVSGSKAGTRAFIPRLMLAPKNPDLPFVLRRRQFPVKLAWCMTLNKAQGQTLKRVGLYLSTPVFSHGQYYVGLSRAGSFESVMVLVVDCDKQGLYEDNEGIPDGVYTDNAVWKEALLHDDAGALQTSAATSKEDPHATKSPVQPPVLQATAQVLATVDHTEQLEEDIH